MWINGVIVHPWGTPLHFQHPPPLHLRGRNCLKYKLHGVSTSGLQLLPCKGEKRYPRLDIMLYGKRRDDLQTINNVLYARVEYSPLFWPYCVHSPHSTYARRPGGALRCLEVHWAIIVIRCKAYLEAASPPCPLPIRCSTVSEVRVYTYRL